MSSLRRRISNPNTVSDVKLTPKTTQNEWENKQDHWSTTGKVRDGLYFPGSPILTLFRIAEGQFYEAQQQTRVVATRYVKQENWEAAVDILYNVAQSLLKADQGGSGGDLSIYLAEVYKQAELKPDANNKGRLLTLLRLFDSEEPTRKKFIGETIGYVESNTLERCTEADTLLDGPQSATNTQLVNRIYIISWVLCMLRNVMRTMQRDILFWARRIRPGF
jgi:hypothetical protein